MSSPPPRGSPLERETAEQDTLTLAGLSGFGGRPTLHPSWREPDHEPVVDPAPPAPVVVIRLSGSRRG